MIELYTGKLGTGKTALMVRRAVQMWRSGSYEGIVTNMRSLRGPMVEPLTTLEDLARVRRRIVLLDELQSLLSSRFFAETRRGDLMVIALGRKLGHWMMATTQHVDRVDKVFRENVVDVHECRFRRMVGDSLYVNGVYADYYDDEKRMKGKGSKPFIRRIPLATLQLYDTMEIVGVDGGAPGPLRGGAPQGWRPWQVIDGKVFKWCSWFPLAEFRRIEARSGFEAAVEAVYYAELWGKPGKAYFDAVAGEAVVDAPLLSYGGGNYNNGRQPNRKNVRRRPVAI